MPVDDQIEECANNALVVRLLVNYQIRAFFRNPFYNYAAPFPHFLPLADVPAQSEVSDDIRIDKQSQNFFETFALRLIAGKCTNGESARTQPEQTQQIQKPVEDHPGCAKRMRHDLIDPPDAFLAINLPLEADLR